MKFLANENFPLDAVEAVRKIGRLFRCSGRLFSKIHRKSLDLSDLRPVNRMASFPP